MCILGDSLIGTQLGEMERILGDMGTWRRGYLETWLLGDMDTWETGILGVMDTWRHGYLET